MLRSTNSKIQGKVEAVNSEPLLENGLQSKKPEEEEVRELAAKVVEDVVKMASEAAQQKNFTDQSTPTNTKNRGCNLQRLPTIQIDTVPSAPSSPVDWTPPDESNEESVIEEPLDESDIQLEIDSAEQESEISSEDVRDFVKLYVEDILTQAMVIAEKKLKIADVSDDEEVQEEDEEESRKEEEGGFSLEEPDSSLSEPEKEIVDESEIRATAEGVVQEVISKALEVAASKLESGFSSLSFPIKFEEAPEDVQEFATSFVKEIIGKAVTVAEEKSVPTVPFNFEDVDLMKTSNPWYIRAREALIRLLRTACFCTPRRVDS